MGETLFSREKRVSPIPLSEKSDTGLYQKKLKANTNSDHVLLELAIDPLPFIFLYEVRLNFFWKGYGKTNFYKKWFSRNFNIKLH